MSVIADNFICPKCFTEGAAILEKRESYHLDNGIYYKIIHITLVCKKGCWHNWDEFYRIKLKDFNEDGKIVKIPYFNEEVIKPSEVSFEKNQ
ncbi:MAG: hypothetical protein ACTSSG_11480 [Candidatus Heimdallarchaeaceae archaeon]